MTATKSKPKKTTKAKKSTKTKAGAKPKVDIEETKADAGDSSLLPMEAKRKELYESMPPEAQKVSDRIGKRQKQMASGVIAMLYDTGDDVKNLLTTIKATTQIMESLAACNGLNVSSLYEAKAIAVAYTKEEVLALANRPMANGNYISWMHIVEILKCGTAAKRKQLFEKVFNESVSATALKEEIKATIPRENIRTGGRKPSKPVHPLAGADDIRELSQKFNNRVDMWEESVFGVIEKMSADKVEPLYLEKLKAAMEEVDKVVANMDKIKTSVHSSYDRVFKIISDQMDAAEEAADKSVQQTEAGKNNSRANTRRPRPAVVTT
jgi:hypothetical protein